MKRHARAEGAHAARRGFVVSDLMAVVLGALAVAGVVIDRPLLAGIGAVVLLVALLARIWARLALEALDYACEVSSPRAFEGDELVLTLTVENRKPLPVPWLRVREPVPAGLAPLDGEHTTPAAFGATALVATTALAGHERVRLRYRLRALARGYYAFGPARLTGGDPFGFYESERVVLRIASTLIVLPRMVPVPDLRLARVRPLGDARVRARVLEDPTLPATVREYAPGDAARAIDWKITARRGAPWVRVNDASTGGAVVLLLECETRVGGPWDDAPRLLEELVRVAASLARDLLARGHAVGLVANGVPPGDHARIAVAPAAGPAQLGLVLESLARVQSIVVKPLSALVEEHAGRVLPFGATAVCIAGVMRDDTRRLVAARARHGARTVLVQVGDADAFEAPGVRSVRLRAAEAQAR